MCKKVRQGKPRDSVIKTYYSFEPKWDCRGAISEPTHRKTFCFKTFCLVRPFEAHTTSLLDGLIHFSHLICNIAFFGINDEIGKT